MRTEFLTLPALTFNRWGLDSVLFVFPLLAVVGLFADADGMGLYLHETWASAIHGCTCRVLLVL